MYSHTALLEPVNPAVGDRHVCRAGFVVELSPSVTTCWRATCQSPETESAEVCLRPSECSDTERGSGHIRGLLQSQSEDVYEDPG